MCTFCERCYNVVLRKPEWSTTKGESGYRYCHIGCEMQTWKKILSNYENQFIKLNSIKSEVCQQMYANIFC